MTQVKIEKQIVELERLATHILELKRRVRPRRPIVIEFSGSPKSGKTTAISSLEIFLRRNGFRTRVLTERASVCPIPNKFDPIFNVWTGCAAMNQLMETLSKSAREVDVVIMDRGFFDALCWFEWQKDLGFLRLQDYNAFQNFFTAPRFRMVVDLVLTFKAKPETSIDREYRNLLTRKEGSVMRQDVLASYAKSIEDSIKKYGTMFRQLVSFSTDDQSQSEVSYKITKITLDQLKSIANEKIAFVQRDSLPSSLGTVFRYNDIRTIVQSSLEFEERNVVENDRSLVQFIPIAVIKQTGELKVMVGRKAEKAVSARSPERGKLLGYFGGHIREEDSTFLVSDDKMDVFKQCLYREVKEELGLDVDPRESNPHCIWVRDGTKSDLHIAVVFIIERDLLNTRVTVDGEELVRYEKKGKHKTGTGSVISGDQLLAREKIDSWTQNILEKVLGIRPEEARTQRSFLKQLSPDS